MEVMSSFIWCSLLTLSFFYFLWLVSKRSSSHKSKLKLPPGPTPFPIIGNLSELGDLPHRSLARLAGTHGPVMTLKLGTTTTIVITSPQAAREALQTQDRFLAARTIPDAMTALDHHKISIVWMSPSPPWKNLRTIIKTHLFTAQRLDANQGIRREKVRELVAFLKGKIGQAVDVRRAALFTALNLMSTTFFSIDLANLNNNSSHELLDLVSEIMEEMGCPNVSDFFPLLKLFDLQGRRRRMAARMNKLESLFDEMIDRRLQGGMNSTNHDFLDVLLKLHIQESESKLDRRLIKSILADTFVGGGDTSSNVVEWAMAELLRNPDAMAKARAELTAVIGHEREVEESDISHLPYLQSVVKETLRLHPPGPLLLPHKAEADVELGGYKIPRNSRVVVNMWAIGRDETVWEDPDSFSPERFLKSEVDFRGRHFELVPFGSGRRICPGLPLAYRMVHLMLASLVHSFEWKLPDGMKPCDVDITEKFGATLTLAVPLPAIPMPVNSQH